MRPTAFFDLHCDTITGFSSLTAEKAAFSLGHLPQDARWAQCCAIFIPDSVRGPEAIAYYEKYRDVLSAECRAHADRITLCKSGQEVENAFSAGHHAAILTVEGAAALAGELSRVEKLFSDGVRMMTLTWNGQNELGSGHDNPEMGLTDFGRKVIGEMERLSMVVDVSHLNDRGFWEVCETAQKPFVASHSNSRRVCPVLRNLTDEQIGEIVRRGGLIGLNYYTEFLGGEEIDLLWRHVDHMLSLGAESVLCLGSDYDGADLPPYLATPAALPDACDYLLARGLREETLLAILSGNAVRFFKQIL